MESPSDGNIQAIGGEESIARSILEHLARGVTWSRVGGAISLQNRLAGAEEASWGGETYSLVESDRMGPQREAVDETADRRERIRGASACSERGLSEAGGVARGGRVEFQVCAASRSLEEEKELREPETLWLWRGRFKFCRGFGRRDSWSRGLARLGGLPESPVSLPAKMVICFLKIRFLKSLIYLDESIALKFI